MHRASYSYGIGGNTIWKSHRCWEEKEQSYLGKFSKKAFSRLQWLLTADSNREQEPSCGTLSWLARSSPELVGGWSIAPWGSRDSQ